MSEFAAAPVELDPERFEQLAEMHWAATTSIRYVSDQEQYGRKEYWTLPTDAGDCEDLVLAMRQELIERGWPRSDFPIAERQQSSRPPVSRRGRSRS